MDLLLKRIESPDCFRAFLLAVNSYAIQIGKWKDSSGKQCCLERKRRVCFQHVMKVGRKQIVCRKEEEVMSRLGESGTVFDKPFEFKQRDTDNPMCHAFTHSYKNASCLFGVF